MFKIKTLTDKMKGTVVESKSENLQAMEKMLGDLPARMNGHTKVFRSGSYETRQNPIFSSEDGEVVFSMIPRRSDFPSHLHPESVEMIYVLVGKLSVIIENETIEVNAGEAYIVSAGVSHGANCEVDTAVICGIFPRAEGLS